MGKYDSLLEKYEHDVKQIDRKGFDESKNNRIDKGLEHVRLFVKYLEDTPALQGIWDNLNENDIPSDYNVGGIWDKMLYLLDNNIIAYGHDPYLNKKSDVMVLPNISQKKRTTRANNAKRVSNIASDEQLHLPQNNYHQISQLPPPQLISSQLPPPQLISSQLPQPQLISPQLPQPQLISPQLPSPQVHPYVSHQGPQQVFAQGFNQGPQQVFAQGFNQGHYIGPNQGHYIGPNQGPQQVFAQGFNQGHYIGPNQGPLKKRLLKPMGIGHYIRNDENPQGVPQNGSVAPKLELGQTITVPIGSSQCRYLNNEGRQQYENFLRAQEQQCGGYKNKAKAKNTKDKKVKIKQ